MANSARLIALPAADAGHVRFELHFPVSGPEDIPLCGEGVLTLTDGTHVKLGVLCAPTADTWTTQRMMALGESVVSEGQEGAAQLEWAGEVLPARFTNGESRAARSRERPVVSWLSTWTMEHTPLDVMVEIELSAIGDDMQVRVDGGAGNVHYLSADSHRIVGKSAEKTHKANWTFAYSKPGTYTLAVDLLDGEGYWLATLAETPVEVASPIEEPETATRARLSNPAPEIQKEIGDAVAQSAGSVPWLPFRYARPQWAWARTYTQAGGSVVSRALSLGTYLAIRQEVTAGGALWYQTGSYDWIPASSVSIITPTDLRGVELGGTLPPPEPEPEPEPEPGEGQRGVVTANVLNVRSGPGTNHPVVDRLRYNVQVRIYEQTTVAGAVWYRIGTGRWVHSGWVRLLDSGDEDPGTSRQGVVTADVLNVRATPGVRADNPPVGRLLRGAQVTIYEESTSDGATWYRIGVDRWVHGGWIRLLTSAQTLAEGYVLPLDQSTPSAPAALPVGWVVGSILNVRSGPGTDTPVVGSVYYKQALSILETRSVSGVNWYRIGPDQWVYGAQVGVARLKARPAAIRATERWVGVNLKEQTVVAYEGDKPVYAALAATGLPRTPTVQGIFRTWWRVASRKMSGGSAATGGYYYLEEVTWTLYFHAGYALHTCYWHDAFGRPRSHGCVNLSPYDAWWIYRWSEPGGANSPAVYVYWE